MSALAPYCCDAAAARARSAGPRARHPVLVLATTILASGLAMIDGSVVNVGLPTIGRDLHGGAADLQWVINAYLLPLSALLLFGGALGDRLGRRNTLVLGVALFAVASAACAGAPGLELLLAGRAVQGIGAALLMPASLAILGASFSGEAKGRAVGTWAAAGAIAGAVGPVLGGWLIDTAGWRSIFLINVPLAAGAIAMALAFVKDRAEPGPRRSTWRAPSWPPPAWEPSPGASRRVRGRAAGPPPRSSPSSPGRFSPRHSSWSRRPRASGR